MINSTSNPSTSAADNRALAHNSQPSSTSATQMKAPVLRSVAGKAQSPDAALGAAATKKTASARS